MNLYIYDIGDLYEKMAEIDLSNEELKVFPEYIFEIDNLVKLVLDYTDINDITPICGLTSLRDLSLSWAMARFIPDEIGWLKNLEILDLYGLMIRSLPDSIGRLKKLKSLNLAQNQVMILPETFGDMISLEEFHADANGLRKLPESFGKLTNLITLNFMNNPIEVIPPYFGNFILLENLTFAYGKFTRLPESFGQLLNLKHLFINENKNLSQFPNPILRLSSLLSVGLTNCQIEEIPDDIIKLEHLQHFNMRGNKLKILPDMTEMEYLELIDFTGNPFEKPFDVFLLTRYSGVEMGCIFRTDEFQNIFALPPK